MSKDKKWTVILNQEQVEFIANALGNYDPACFEQEDRDECELLHGMFNNLLIAPNDGGDDDLTTLTNDFTA